MISFSWADYFIFALFLFVMVEITFFFSKKNLSTSDYLLGGRKLTLPVFVLTMFSTWYGGILGIGEFGYMFGVAGWFLQGVPYYFFAIVFALIFAKRARKIEVFTTCEQLQRTYGKKVGVLSAFLTMILASPAPYVLMAAVIFQMVFKFSLATSLILTVLFSIAYLIRGGFIADRATDVFFAILMFLGFIMLLFFLNLHYGTPQKVFENIPLTHKSWHGGLAPQFIVMWFLIASWTWVEPTFYQRCYAAQDESVAKKGILYSVLFWFLFDMITIMSALYAKAMIPEIENPMHTYPLLAEIVLPPFAKGLFFVSMMATIISTLNSQFFVSATSVGRDFLGQITKTNITEKRWIQMGLIFTGIMAICMALLIPSVVRLWYTIGTVMIPGLLIAMISSLYPRLQISSTMMFLSMIAGVLISLLCLIIGWSSGLGSYDQYPFGVEPIFPGLMSAFLFWFLGMMRKKRNV